MSTIQHQCTHDATGMYQLGQFLELPRYIFTMVIEFTSTLAFRKLYIHHGHCIRANASYNPISFNLPSPYSIPCRLPAKVTTSMVTIYCTSCTLALHTSLPPFTPRIVSMAMSIVRSVVHDGSIEFFSKQPLDAQCTHARQC